MATQPAPGFRPRTTILVVAAMLLLGVVVIVLDRRQVVQLVGQADWRPMLGALLFAAVSYVCASLSVVLMLRVFEVQLAPGYLFRVGLLSVVLQNLIALAASISLRLLLLGGRGVGNSQTLGASLLLAYFKNLAFFALIPPSLIYLMLAYKLPPGALTSLALTCAVSLAGLALATVVVLHRRTRISVLRLIRRAWQLLTRRNIRPSLVPFERAVAAGIQHLRAHPGIRTPLILLILTDVGATIVTLWFCFLALGIPIAPGALLSGFNFGITLTAVSFLPGDLGVQEATMAGVFALFGVPFSQGVLAAVLFRVLFYFVPFVVSLGFYWHTLRDAAGGRVAA